MNLPLELRQNYIERRKKDVEALKAALAKNDLSVAQRVGHQLKGNGISYGFPLLSELGLEMESLAKENNLAGVVKIVQRLEDWLSSIS